MLGISKHSIILSATIIDLTDALNVDRLCKNRQKGHSRQREQLELSQRDDKAWGIYGRL